MRPFRFAALACLLLSCASALLLDRGVGLAQSGGTFDLSRFTVDNGGGAASAGSFTLGATLGQPDTGSPDVRGSLQPARRVLAAAGLPHGASAGD